MNDIFHKSILLGAGGHAKVLLDTLLCMSTDVAGLTDINYSQLGYDQVLGVPVLGDDSVVLAMDSDSVLLINGIGGIHANETRRLVFERFKTECYRFKSVIHPSAAIGRECTLGEGVQILAGAIIQPGCTIGDDTIVSTRASVDHDCTLGRHVHLSPGTTLSGEVFVDDCAHIGTGASVIQQVKIGSGSTVAAGATVISDVPDGATVAGVPARVIRRREKLQ
jgi:sugar O-acyltransferase (sialic acid O-acetyltransferase NeuD family)